MAEPVHIALLANYREAIPVIAVWFADEWAPFYGPGGPGDAAADLGASCNRDSLPLALVALDSKVRAVGTASLKAQSPLGTERYPGPWLAAMIVEPSRRGAGIGAALPATFQTIFATTRRRISR